MFYKLWYRKSTLGIWSTLALHTSMSSQLNLCPIQVFTCPKKVDRNRLLCLTHNCFYTHVHKPGSIIMARKFSLSMWCIQREHSLPVQTDIRNLLMKATQKLIRQFRGRKPPQKWSIFSMERSRKYPRFLVRIPEGNSSFSRPPKLEPLLEGHGKM